MASPMPKLFAPILIAFSIATTPVAAEKWDCGPPPPKFKSEDEMWEWWLHAATKYLWENPPNRSMMFHSPETIDQALKRGLFKRDVIDEVARRDLLGKSVAEADQFLKNLGFRRNNKDPSVYHWNGSAGCFSMGGVTVNMGLTIANGVVAGVDTTIRFIYP
jgi:hypothetical protein